MLGEETVQLVIEQMAQVQAEQPELELALLDTGKMVARGTVRFCIDHNDCTYTDAYEVEISVPREFPHSVHTVTETAGRIPLNFHRFSNTGELCLGVPVELMRVFSQDRTLSCFINRLLIPYLFSFTYYREHGEMPHGELSHGLLGLLEYYQEFFRAGPLTVMKLLKLLADALAPPLMGCPCGSGRKLQDCHGSKLLELQSLLPPAHFERDLREMIAVARTAGLRLPERDIMPRRMWKNRQKRLRKRATWRR